MVELLELNIKDRQGIPELLTTNLLLMHVIALDMESVLWIGVEFFLLAQYRSILIEQFINLTKLRFANLKFMTDLRD